MTSQKSQKLKLGHLPVELPFQISGELATDPSSLSAQDCVESSLYSHAPSHICVPLYYLSDNYCGFRAAVKNADFEAMNRCAKYGGAQDTTRKLPKPIDELLESVYLGKVPTEKGIDASKRLLESHFDMKEQRDQAWYDVNTHCDHFPDFLITMLSKSPDRVYTEGICQMIKLPQSYGNWLPFNMESDTYWYSENADRYLSGITRKPLDVALRSHCPLYLLEVIIRDDTRRRVDFTTTHVDPPAFMQSWAGDYRFACDEYPVAQQWWKYTNLLETTWGLFLDLMDTSTSWEEQYRGEASDIFEQKIEILIKHHVLHEVEEDMLRSIVEAMRSMNTPTKTSSTAVADDFDAQCCWDTLCSALMPFKSMHEELHIWR